MIDVFMRKVETRQRDRRPEALQHCGEDLAEPRHIDPQVRRLRHGSGRLLAPQQFPVDRKNLLHDLPG
jgi:hypothetical protein